MKKLLVLSLAVATLAFANPLDRAQVTTNANGAEITNNTVTNRVHQETVGNENVVTNGVLIQGADVVSSKINNNSNLFRTTSKTDGDENAINNGTVIQ